MLASFRALRWRCRPGTPFELFFILYVPAPAPAGNRVGSSQISRYSVFLFFKPRHPFPNYRALKRRRVDPLSVKTTPSRPYKSFLRMFCSLLATFQGLYLSGSLERQSLEELDLSSVPLHPKTTTTMKIISVACLQDNYAYLYVHLSLPLSVRLLWDSAPADLI